MTDEVMFSERVQTVEQLREIIGNPTRDVIEKVIHELDEHSQAFIAKSTFVLIGSSDAQGNADVSPKGDPAGFVHMLDATTLLIPDRPGNQRADTLINILENPQVGLLFLVPGKRETLRINGKAQLIRDANLREQFAIKGKIPALLIAVTVEDVFFHCAKCIIRSHLWDDMPDQSDLASLAEIMVKHGKLSETVQEMQQGIDEDYTTRLY